MGSSHASLIQMPLKLVAIHGDFQLCWNSRVLCARADCLKINDKTSQRFKDKKNTVYHPWLFISGFGKSCFIIILFFSWNAVKCCVEYHHLSLLCKKELHHLYLQFTFIWRTGWATGLHNSIRLLIQSWLGVDCSLNTCFCVTWKWNIVMFKHHVFLNVNSMTFSCFVQKQEKWLMRKWCYKWNRYELIAQFYQNCFFFYLWVISRLLSFVSLHT